MTRNALALRGTRVRIPPSPPENSALCPLRTRAFLYFHWYVKGSQFFTIHAKLEEYYDEIRGAVDEIAERLSVCIVNLSQSELIQLYQLILSCAESKLRCGFYGVYTVAALHSFQKVISSRILGPVNQIQTRLI